MLWELHIKHCMYLHSLLVSRFEITNTGSSVLIGFKEYLYKWKPKWDINQYFHRSNMTTSSKYIPGWLLLLYILAKSNAFIFSMCILNTTSCFFFFCAFCLFTTHKFNALSHFLFGSINAIKLGLREAQVIQTNTCSKSGRVTKVLMLLQGYLALLS